VADGCEEWVWTRADEVSWHTFLACIFADGNYSSWQREDGVGPDLEADLCGKGGKEGEVFRFGSWDDA